MHAIYRLSFRSGVELRFHDVDARGGSEVETETAGSDGDEDDGDFGVGREGLEGTGASGAGHAAVKAGVGEAGVVKGNLDEVEVSRPAGEYHTARAVSSVQIRRVTMKSSKWNLIGALLTS